MMPTADIKKKKIHSPTFKRGSFKREKKGQTKNKKQKTKLKYEYTCIHAAHYNMNIYVHGSTNGA